MEVVTKLPTVEQRDSELRQILKALGAFRRGDVGVTLPSEWDGLYGKIANEFNELTTQTARTSLKLKALDPATPSPELMPMEKFIGFSTLPHAGFSLPRTPTYWL